MNIHTGRHDRDHEKKIVSGSEEKYGRGRSIGGSVHQPGVSPSIFRPRRSLINMAIHSFILSLALDPSRGALFHWLDFCGFWWSPSPPSPRGLARLLRRGKCDDCFISPPRNNKVRKATTPTADGAKQKTDDDDKNKTNNALTDTVKKAEDLVLLKARSFSLLRHFRFFSSDART